MVKGLIILEPGNKMLEDMVQKRVAPGARRPMEPADVRLADFDDTIYRFLVSPEQPSVMQLSISMRPIADLKKYGAQVMLDEQYKGMNVTPALEGFDVTIQCDVEKTSESPEAIVKKFSQLKRNLMGAPFDQCFTALVNGTAKQLPPIQIQYRKDETVYIRPGADRVVIVYSIHFSDKSEQAIARVFLQEFVEARRHVNGAPVVSFSRDPPMELRGVSGLSTSTDLIGYTSFVIFASHVEGSKREPAVSLIQSFRQYLHYHIKTAKSHLHTRMRKRVNLMLQVLNRAIPSDTNDDKKSTTSIFA